MIDVMPFIVKYVMKWINVKIVGRWFVKVVERFVVVNFVDVVYVKIVPRLVEGEFCYDDNYDDDECLVLNPIIIYMYSRKEILTIPFRNILGVELFFVREMLNLLSNVIHVKCRIVLFVWPVEPKIHV